MIYVVHKIRLAGRASRYSAWFKENPLGRYTSMQVVLDAERIDRRGRSYPVTDAELSLLCYGPWSASRAPVAMDWGDFHARRVEGGAA
jgi:hypothetical protein